MRWLGRRARARRILYPLFPALALYYATLRLFAIAPIDSALAAAFSSHLTEPFRAQGRALTRPLFSFPSRPHPSGSAFSRVMLPSPGVWFNYAVLAQHSVQWDYADTTRAEGL